MKIAIDTTPLSSGHRHRGIGTYTRLLIQALTNYGNVTIVPSVTQADVVHYPFFDLFFLTLPLLKSKPTVVTIHDVIPLVFADHYPPGIRGSLKYWVQKNSLQSVSAMVTDSDCSTQDVITFLHQPHEKVSTVYLAPDPSLQPAASHVVDQVKKRYSLNKPYFLYVGDINYNKNLAGLFTAFVTLPRDYELVVVSKAMRRDNLASFQLWNHYDQLELNDRVHVLNTVESDELSGLYSGAYWYVQPSLYEGFGLPVLEAQVCGCPVIASTGGSLKEIIGEVTPSFDPADQQAFTAALLRVATQPRDYRDTVIQSGFTNVQRFSWKKTAGRMVEVYTSLVR